METRAKSRAQHPGPSGSAYSANSIICRNLVLASANFCWQYQRQAAMENSHKHLELS